MFKFKNRLLKYSYGYDTSGAVIEHSGSNADQTHIDDSAEPYRQHETSQPEANLAGDPEAEEDFPSLQGRNLTKIIPPRSR